MKRRYLGWQSFKGKKLGMSFLFQLEPYLGPYSDKSNVLK